MKKIMKSTIQSGKSASKKAAAVKPAPVKAAKPAKVRTEAEIHASGDDDAPKQTGGKKKEFTTAVLSVLKGETTPAAAAAALLGPNEKYPFAVKLTTATGDSFERFKTAEARDLRLAVLGKSETVAPVDFVKPAPVEPVVSGVAPVEPAKTGKKKAAKKASVKKAAKPADNGAPKMRLYAKGEFYFGRGAKELVGDAPFIAMEVKGKRITLTPTKAEKGNHKVMFCHANPVLRVAKVLEATGWSKQTQDLTVSPVGEKGLSFEIA